MFFNINADGLCPGQVYVDSSEYLSFSTFVWIKMSESLRASVAQVFYYWFLNMWRLLGLLGPEFWQRTRARNTLVRLVAEFILATGREVNE